MYIRTYVWRSPRRRTVSKRDESSFINPERAQVDKNANERAHARSWCHNIYIYTHTHKIRKEKRRVYNTTFTAVAFTRAPSQARLSQARPGQARPGQARPRPKSSARRMAPPPPPALAPTLAPAWLCCSSLHTRTNKHTYTCFRSLHHYAPGLQPQRTYTHTHTHTHTPLHIRTSNSCSQPKLGSGWNKCGESPEGGNKEEKTNSFRNGVRIISRKKNGDFTV